MVRLYLLGFTHDLKGVVFGQRRNAKKATFWLPVDDTFLSALDKLERARVEREREGKGGKPRGSGDVLDLDDLKTGRRAKVALPPVGRSQARSGLGASEIQQMLREGKTAKTVAQAAKTPLAWVERLAEPVITERMGVVRLAQRAYMSRARLGPSGLQLGDAVVRNLEERRTTIDTVDAVWDARVGASSGAWRVSLRFSHRGKRRVAEWEFRKGSRQILPRNRLGSQLGWWPPEPVAPEPGAAEEEADEASEEERKSAPRNRPPARRAPAKRRSAKRSPTKRAPGRKKATRRAAPRSGRRRR